MNNSDPWSKFGATFGLAPLLAGLDRTPLASCRRALESICRANFHPSRHGRLAHWLAQVEALPRPPTVTTDYEAPAVRGVCEVDSADRQRIYRALAALGPWRKGPFDLHGVFIDSEWRSDLKWGRVSSHLDLDGAHVLDVGCGNGYYGWRMLGAGAERVVGIDPTVLFVAQFLAVRKLLAEDRNVVLPLGIDELPAEATGFDHVFSMGVLYHRRSPIDHLERLRSLLQPGGRLILETLVIDGDEGRVLTPRDRYAGMRNVWFIPALPLLETWLQRTRFGDIEVLDVTPTTAEEQRCTEWSGNRSLADFLDPNTPSLTVEGHPAPLRAVISARS